MTVPNKDYAVAMARYNLWQNESLMAAASGLDAAARQLDRGAFFGSIEKTFAHILWGDRIWLDRFAGTGAPTGGITQSAVMEQSWDAFCIARAAFDAQILAWAHGVDAAWFDADLSWYSGAVGREVTKPKQVLVLQLFNHQTHHRGQIHAMLTAAGARPGDTDIPFMPERFDALQMDTRMDIRAIFMGLAFALMWSSAFTSARMIVADAPPMTALALRFLVSGLIGVGIAYALGQTARLTRNQWRATILFGICQNALYLGFNFVAMQWVEASLAAIVASTMPLVVALAGWLIFRERLPALGYAGLVAGMIGVGIIMGHRISDGVDLMGLGFLGIGVLALAFATLSVRGAMAGGNLLMVVGLQMLVGSALLSVAAISLESWDINWTPRLGWAFAYTTLVPGLLATWVWFKLVERIGAVRAAAFHFLNPFFGVVVASVLLGESLTLWDVAGVVIIAGGILAVQLARVQRAS